MVPSSYQPKKTHKPRTAIRTTEISQSSRPINLVIDETVYKEWEDRMGTAATTASSLDWSQVPRYHIGGVDAQTRFETTFKKSNDPPLSRGYTLGSGDDSMKLLELVELCTKLSDLVRKKKREMLTLEDGDVEILQHIWPQLKTITEASLRRYLKLEDVDGISSLPNTEIFEQLALIGHAEIALMAYKEEIDAEKDIDAKFFKQLRVLQRLNGRILGASVRFFAQQRAEAKRNKPMTQAQQRTYMSNYIKNQEGGYSIKQLKSLSFEEVKEICETTMKRSSLCLWITELGSSEIKEQVKNMLKRFDRDNLEKLWDLVKKRFRSTEPTVDKEKKAQQLKPKLYDGNVIKNTHAIMITDSEETLMLAEESHSKMLLKQQDPMVLEKKVNTTPVDYVNSMNSSDPSPSCRPTKVEEMFQRDNSISNQSAPNFDQYFSLNELKAQSQEKDTVIKKLKERIKSLNGNINKDKVKKDIEEIETLNIELDHMVKKDLVIIALKNELRKLKGKDLADNVVTKRPIAPEMLKIDVVKSSTSASGSQPSGNTKKDKIQQTPSSTQKNKVEAHLRTVKSSLKNKNNVVEPKGTTNVQHSKLNANSELPCVKCNGYMLSDNHDLCVLDFINDVNARNKSKSIKKSSKRKVSKPTGKVFTNIGYTWRPTGRTFTVVGNACPLTRITTTTDVPFRKPTTLESDTPKPVVVQIVLWYLDSGCSKHMTGDRSHLTNFVNKFLGTVKFGNDHVAKILGYGDYQIGNVTISRVYYVEGP
ncbi:hypothetical protein Tco_0157870, partial [Tanacetum coccineum]